MASAAGPAHPRESRWPATTRYGLLIVGFAPLLAQLIGSAFNIWYNLIHIRPLLSEAQHDRFREAVLITNLVIYPVATAIWARAVASLRNPLRRMREGRTISSGELLQAQRRAVNLPWWMLGVAAPAWLLTIPALLGALAMSPEPLGRLVWIHLPISVAVAGSIAVTHGMFAVELTSLRCLYPVVFRDDLPPRIPGARPLSLRGRGLFLAVSAVVCPIVSLLLLMLVQREGESPDPRFAASVGGLSILFGLASAWMLGRLVTEPIHRLRRATAQVAEGNLDTVVDARRADEFGPLIRNFNEMVAGLREKQYLHEQFGRHVGREAARRILDRDPGLSGTEQELTVMFADLRNFTARSANCRPQEVVEMLNRFFSEMVEVIEQQHGGMVDKFLGDGLMALFGADDPHSDHADRAVAAGCNMLQAVERLNRNRAECDSPLAVGIGIHTGPAIVGSIGSQRRGDYTAIGDTVNVASRVEGLTKQLGVPLLVTASTRSRLSRALDLCEFAAQPVKGVAEPVPVFGVQLDRAAETGATS